MLKGLFPSLLTPKAGLANWGLQETPDSLKLQETLCVLCTFPGEGLQLLWGPKGICDSKEVAGYSANSWGGRYLPFCLWPPLLHT